jgi:magnesium chelatase subunit D
VSSGSAGSEEAVFGERVAPVRPHLPWSSVVGQEDAKTALLLAAVEPRLGGVLLRGEKGSAKTTLARGLAALLADGAPFVELPLGATEDRVVGSIDVAALLAERTHTFRPGLLAAAHGGVLYVDEINLLADHLVDTLLDVATSGVNRVERDGLSQTHPARFVLVGSMNPEEGELRPQLLDRFGLAVDVRAPADPALRAEIVRRQMAFDRAGADPAAVAADAAARRALAGAAPARLDDATIDAAARLAVAVGAEGLRADLSLCRAATALAGWDGRPETDVEDLRRVAALVLTHRRRRDPFESSSLGESELDDALDEALRPPAGPGTDGWAGADGAAGAEGGDGRADGGAGAEGGAGADGAAGAEGGAGADGAAGAEGSDGPADGGGRPDPPAPPDLTWPEPESLPAVALPRPTAGARRSPPGRAAAAPGTTGRMVRDVPLERADQRLAVTATAVAHAVRTGGGGRDPAAALLEKADLEPAALEPAALDPADLRAVVAEETRANLVILAVDLSGSMAARRRLVVARRAVLGLLGDAYRRRDRVALIVFRGTSAEVVLRPTGSVEIARNRLADLPTGGTTPLAAGLAAVTALVRSTLRAGGPDPVAVLITDGRATAGGVDPLAAAQRAAAELAATGVPGLVLDAETGPIRLGLARALAVTLGADHLELEALERSGDDRAVERAIGARLASPSSGAGRPG